MIQLCIHIYKIVRNISFAFRKPSLPDRPHGSSVGQTGTEHPSVWGDCQCSYWRWFICHLHYPGVYPGNKCYIIATCQQVKKSTYYNNHSNWSLVLFIVVRDNNIIYISLNIYFSLSTCTVHPTIYQQCHACWSNCHHHGHGHPG